MRNHSFGILSSRVVVTSWFVLTIGLMGCRCDAQESGGGESAVRQTARVQGGKKMTIEITSTAFAQGHPIPKKYTGEGADVSPPLAWSGIPEGTKELVLICDDPDAPTDEPWVHWVIYKMPADTKGLPEGVPRKPRLKEPHGALQGRNSWPASEAIGYRGPMPPPGHGTHHYYFKLYAVEAHMVAEPGLDKKTVMAEIGDHVLAEGVLMGTYQR